MPPRQFIPRSKPSWLGRITRVLSKIEATHYAVERLLAMTDTLASDIASLQTSVENLTTVDGSAITLIQGFSAQLAAALAAASANGATEAQLADLTALRVTIDSQTTALANAVASNTVASAPPAPSADTTAGGQGSDTITTTAPDGSETTSGSAGDDTLAATTGNDTLTA